MTKSIFKKTALIVTLGSALLGGNAMAVSLPQNATAVEVPAQNIQLSQNWDKIFPKSDKVDHRKVTFKNRYGMTLVGDLYVPKNAQGKLQAIAISGPFGAVKEQSSGLYAQHLAERGFATLAFDGSFTGESSGEPRNMPSPEINTEDFSAAVDYLGSLDFVNRDEIGILGICGWGGFSLNAAVSDPRIKAVATSTMYNMTRVVSNGYEIDMQQNAKGSYDRKPAQTAEERYNMRLQMNNARWDAAKNGYATLQPANNIDPSKDIKADTPKFIAEYADFYRTERGFHPRAINSNPNGSWTTTAMIPLANMPILQYAAELKVPALIVHGENAHSRYFAEETYKLLGSKNKELYIVKGASHIDLYDDKANNVPYDKFAEFFKANLK